MEIENLNIGIEQIYYLFLTFSDNQVSDAKMKINNCYIKYFSLSKETVLEPLIEEFILIALEKYELESLDMFN